MSVSDRLRGVLLGLAAGDLNGGPTRMVLRVAESLVERGRFAPDDILDRYLDWWRQRVSGSSPGELARGLP